MRIAIVNRTNRLIGGAENYLARTIPELRRRGCELAFFSELDTPGYGIRIDVGTRGPSWCVSEIGVNAAFSALREWHPDLIYGHGLASAEIEGALYRDHPSVAFVHGYHGTCISGRKSFRVPELACCDRKFGASCLVHYFPRRCGGNSPVTMWREYRLQSARLDNLHSCRGLVAASEYVRDAYVKNCFARDFVHVIRLPVVNSPVTCESEINASVPPSLTLDGELRLLFAGRMVSEKGGALLIEALPSVAARLERKVCLNFVGDGPARSAWESRARALALRNSAVEVYFSGWGSPEDVAVSIEKAHLLVVPSVWPEPFGQIGVEAASRGVPAAAFAVGGIREWLHNGVNGYLADAHPPSSAGLADAIVACTIEPATYAQLSRAARGIAMQFSVAGHVSALLELFSTVLSGTATSNPPSQTRINQVPITQ